MVILLKLEWFCYLIHFYVNVSSKVYLDLNHSFSSGLRSGQVMWHCSIYGEFLATELIFEFLGYLRQFLVWFQSSNLEGVNLQWTSCYLFLSQSWELVHMMELRDLSWINALRRTRFNFCYTNNFMIAEVWSDLQPPPRMYATDWTTSEYLFLSFYWFFFSFHFSISQHNGRRTKEKYICGYREKLKQENAFCLYGLLKCLRNPIKCFQQNLGFQYLILPI